MVGVELGRCFRKLESDPVGYGYQPVEGGCPGLVMIRLLLGNRLNNGDLTCRVPDRHTSIEWLLVAAALE